MSVILYGIKNCDTVKKARRWLDDHSVPYTFHDFRVDGISKKLINDILKDNDLDTVINKRGTSWRKLPDQEKEFGSKAEAVELMMNNPTIIKRPVLKTEQGFAIGFSEATYQERITING